MKNHKHFTDKYFIRSNEILKSEGINPWVRAQVFIRKGPGTVAGIEEAINLILENSDLEKHGGKIYALKDGDKYAPKETQMIIEAPIQDIIELETTYLGVITAATTIANGGNEPDLEKVTETMSRVVEATKNQLAPEGRPVSYFGARHWHWSKDSDLAKAAYEGGAKTCSTDAGAETYGSVGMGTIPHALENIYAWKHGIRRGVVESTKAFDRVIDKSIPRIALIDYANREVDDAIQTAIELEGRLSAVRIDTCGENRSQGVSSSSPCPEGINEKYWACKGVSILGTLLVRDALNRAKFKDVGIFLSSGFGDPEKVMAFSEAEEILGTKLYDGLGVGGVYDARMATMDIMAVGNSPETMIEIHKVGREYKPNNRLELVTEVEEWAA